MSTCLKDSTLLLLLADGGTREQHAHLETCDVCTARYQRINHDLQTIERVLWKTSPAPVVSSRLSIPAVRWVPVAAVLTVIVSLLWSSDWLRQPSRQNVSTKIVTEEVGALLTKEVSPALFATADARVIPVPAPVSNEVYLEAALEGGWPCARQETSSYAECDFYPLPILLEEY
jgi:hypothetical protein